MINSIFVNFSLMISLTVFDTNFVDDILQSIQKSNGHDLSLTMYLFEPIQRMSRYPLLLNRLHDQVNYRKDYSSWIEPFKGSDFWDNIRANNGWTIILDDNSDTTVKGVEGATFYSR
jgi:hypothetical protein